MGGRAARQALRAAPIPEDQKPVRPGLSSGRYQPLSQEQVLRIHEAAIETLETIGFANSLPSCVELVTAAGGSLTSDGRLLMPRALVEESLEKAAKNITLYAQDPRFDLDLTDSRTYFGTAGAAVHVVDTVKREYRESTAQDLYDAARIVDQMEHIHFFQRSMVLRDIENPAEMDFNTCYASVAGTRKHVGTSFVDPAHAHQAIDMLEMIAGGEQAWRERPFVSLSCCFVVPPMRFAEDACRVLEVCVERGMPILLLAAGQAGATSPASLAGAVVQEVAEVLGGFVYVNLLKPGHPAIFGTWPFVSDLRTGAMSGGSGEQAVLMAACGQMGRFYGLPTGIAAGMADAKLPDAQSGYEKSYTNVLAGHSGANLIYEAAGMQASLLGCCLESYVIDNDMLGAINRTIRGIEVDDTSLSVDTIRDVCIGGPNHFLGHDQTMALMQRDYVYPEVGDRLSPKEWNEKGRPDLLETARARVAEILSGPRPTHLSAEMDQAIRARFPVRLNAQASGEEAA
ncbi:MAG: trimethylamine methyltransferase family protein [Arenicellales bacterium]|jgi:trimethylamine--corrinoid protein Co-methyltransferase